jgi:hypothetical protein
VLNSFIEAELIKFTEIVSRLSRPVAPVEQLNELFREMLKLTSEISHTALTPGRGVGL